MNCINCGEKIPEGRLKALPKTKVCVKCSTSEKVAGFRLIEGKTEYSALQIVPQETAKRLYKLQERKGQSPGRGVKMK